ncbi:fumarylacetoacetate hydrolase family protein [Patulibacter minatonensis]|uniref:fumarylacetoacetate hydrolase family protein n=1 Tax=Patulibacter minatonensis TaxID=298163 RepID=UPI00047E906C|nr:fumarylacetoacetate hydrolase family protein [Patulibacter minatonensis]
MRLARFTHPSIAGSVLHGEVRDDRVVAFSDGSTVLSRLDSGDRSPAAGEAFALDAVELLMPHEPGVIHGIGKNYAAHAAEMGGDVPTVPIVFLMPPTAATGPSGPVVRPAVTEQLDYEVELAIVLGRLPDGAVGAAGFCVADDVSARDLQDTEDQWARAKGADTFVPFGPWITTSDELAARDVAWDGGTPVVRVRTWVNDEPRQDASTADLVFGVDALLTHIGAAITLRPGDLVLTGTPHGVGKATERADGSGTGVWLVPGDVVRMEIEGLGTIEHPITAP